MAIVLHAVVIIIKQNVKPYSASCLYIDMAAVAFYCDLLTCYCPAS